jgi:hypothetical protein
MRGRPTRRTLIACGAPALAAIFSASAIAAATPILAGPWAPNQRGYGHARPSTVFNGGDPTGLVSDIHWATWGGAKAIGTGTSDYVGPTQSVAGGTEESARIVAFHLGSCHGRRAYDAVEWYFPQHGNRFNARTYIDPCTGTYFQGGKPQP